MPLAKQIFRCTRCHNIRKDMSNGRKSCQKCLDSKRNHIMTRAEKDSYNTTRRKWYKTAHGFEMAIAHARVGAALKNGKLFKNPCEVCCTTEVEAHHDDYSKQLNVRWLCKKHHSEVHYVCMG